MIVSSLLARLGLVLQGSNAHLEMLPKDEPKKSPGAGSDSEESDESEDEDESDEGGEESEDESDEDDESEDDKKPGKGKPSDEDESDEDEPDDEGEGDEDGEEDPDEDDDSNHGQDDPTSQEEDADEGEDDDSDPADGGDDSDEDESDEGEGGEGGAEGGESEGAEGEDESDENDGEPAEGEGQGEGGSGPAGVASPQELQDAIDFAQSLVDALEAGAETGLVDNNSALGDALKTEVKADILKNEQAWRPLNPDLDTVSTVHSADAATANALLFSVKKEIAYLATKMRAKFLSARAPHITHGVRKGRDLSERRIVESVIEIQSGRRPTRPDWDRHNREECSLATALVLDESGSMGSLRTDVARAALAIASPMDTLGAPCLVVGPRGGDGFSRGGGEMFEGGRKVFHRANGVTIDVFKDWDEDLRSCLRRFPNVKASGGTPLEDGIQYAMQEMSKRPERHRVILVLTDGLPANPPVCTRQIRQAAEAGIHIIGIALDSSCAYSVRALFPENVAVENIGALPNQLLGVLDSIMFPKVGRKIKFDVTLAAKKDKR